ncbi:MAG TPA: deaminase, partial [Smithellaceae bacterium]|nr:deaminase [Smithellaceae bacterium]
MTQRDEIDQAYMKTALEEARLGGLQDEVPVGAVVVSGERILAAAHNETVSAPDAAAHAEMIAIREACRAA